MEIGHAKDKWILRFALVFFGTICGIAYHFYKMDRYADYFWNIRLPVLMILGILVFYIINWLSLRMFKLVSVQYDARIQLEDMKTYLPLALIPLFPLQKKFFAFFWPGPVFGYFLGAYVLFVLILKCFLLAGLARNSAHVNGDGSASAVGNGWLCLAALVIAIPLFWFHQFTLAYDDFFGLARYGQSRVHFLRENQITKSNVISDRTVRRSVKVPDEKTKAVVDFRILKSPSTAAASPIPVAFTLQVIDDGGNVLARESKTLNAADENAGNWHNFEFELFRKKGDSITFIFETRLGVWKMKWKHLLSFLLHSPLDFSYYQDSSVRAAWSEPDLVSCNENKPNVILISIDVLRADSLGCYGYERNVSPAVDSFARENIIFENAFSQATWTLPSHLSMLTSRFPNEFEKYEFEKDIHGPRFAGFGFLEGKKARVIEFETLAERFNQNGYYCVAFTDGVFVSAYYGFYRGFHLYNEEFKANSFKLAQQWIRENREKNFFMFLHTYLVHEYEKGMKDILSFGSPEEVDRLRSSINSLFPDNKEREELLSSGPEKRPRDWYDVRIRLVDSYLDNFFSFLRESGLYDNAMIIFTSDHGHSFGEAHNDGKTILKGHAGPPYDEQIRVPLIVKLPARMSAGPLVIEDDARLLDVAPSVLAVLGFNESPNFLGRSVLPGFRYGGDERPLPVAILKGKTGCIRGNGRKYMYFSPNHEEFYNISKDPKETTNLVSLQSHEMQELRKKYFQFLSRFGQESFSIEDSTEAVPADLQEGLKALGYID